MKRINSKSWLPADGMQLEANALSVAKDIGNSLVVAGPGAGKTELLAQKACYLLQTNTCKFPHKVLAISFKRDAAYNLKERVRLRCGDELSKRFDSLTFDSFAKQLLDRFKHSLPDNFKIADQYEIIMNDRQVILDLYKAEDLDYFNKIGSDALMSRHTVQLPYANHTRSHQIRDAVWRKMLNPKSSNLSFKMIMRLAELLINTNPKVKKYLQQTYQYVFLDEFQDTTGIQYDLFKSCFLNSNCSFTAVGDDKQRIMMWAGAHNTVFEDFIADTNAVRIPLAMNFRCAPRLVALLNHLTQNLLGKNDFATPSPKWHPEQGECDVWLFDNPNSETETLFHVVQEAIVKNSLNPRDICILVKQKLDVYAGVLITYFNQNGIQARDENKFQDILTQEISVFVINMLYTVFQEKSGANKLDTFSFLSNLHTELEDDQLMKLEVSFFKFVKKVRSDYRKSNLTDDEIKTLIAEIIDYANIDRIRAHVPAYKKLAVLKTAINDLQEELIKSFHKTADMISALDVLMGKNTIPVMTIHKSKGLEYHTVIFVGLEDGAFWSFQTQADEDKCAFFVALSRAKERVIFTFSKQRKGKYGMENQTFTNIMVLFEELEKSGIANIEEK